MEVTGNLISAFLLCENDIMGGKKNIRLINQQMENWTEVGMKMKMEIEKCKK